MTGCFKERLRYGAALSALAAALTVSFAAPSHAIIVRDDVGLGASVDVDDVWGSNVQLFLQDNATGGIFFNCSGTLINPRTVLTAAHCLNSSSSEAYGLPGQAPLTSLVGFGPDTSTALFNYIGAGGVLPYSQGGVASSTDVIIHPSSNLDNGGLPFPWADVALVALNEPITDRPTSAMLFSPLDALTHVVVGGYGTFGTGLTGEQGIGFQRIIGENELGIIGSNADLIDGIFPGLAPSAVTSGIDTQTLYFIDFDNPDRTPEQQENCTFMPTNILCTDIDAVRAIDWFDGDATPREAATAGGDSGSALFADELAEFPLILGVLSGGWDFFGLGNQYSDISFYNPLFPFHEFISANSPYKYVSALPGDGEWTDPNHWVQDLDPNYFVIDENGEFVNGLPAGSEEGVYASDDKVGTILGNDISGNSTDDSPLLPPQGSGGEGSAATGAASPEPADAPVTSADGGVTTNPVGGPATARADTYIGSLESAPNADAAAEDITSVSNPQPVAELDPVNFGDNLPQSSVLVGPGSTGFVPNNTDGTPGVAFSDPAQYFEVWLNAAGRTRLSNADIEIDRLTINNGGATLLIEENGSLSVLDTTEVWAGTLALNDTGVLSTRVLTNDLGFVIGTGTINTLLFQNRGGIVAPGMETFDIGTLTINGDFTQLGQGVTMIELGNDGIDMLNISGAATLGGTLIVGTLDGLIPTRGTRFTFLEAQGGVTGSYSSLLTQYTAVLSYDALYGPTFVDLEAVAADYVNVLGDDGSPQALALGAAIDAATEPNELPAGEFGTVVSTLDASPTAAALDASLLSMSPTETFLFDQFSFQTSRAMGRMLMDRAILRHHGGGTGVDTSNYSAAGNQLANVGSDASSIAAAAANADARTHHFAEWTGLEEVGFFLAGDYTTGDFDGVKDEYDVSNYWIAAGADARLFEGVFVGAAFNYGDFNAEGDQFGVREMTGSTLGVSGYASTGSGPLFLHGYVGYNWLDLESSRPIFVGPNAFVAKGETDGTQFFGGALAEFRLPVFEGVTAGPVIRLRHSSADIDGYAETGAGPFGSILSDREIDQTLFGYGIGVTAGWDGDIPVSLFGRFTVEEDLSPDSGFLTSGALVSAPGVSFGIPGQEIDSQFYTVSAGFSSQLTEIVMFQLMIEKDFSRDYQDYTSVSGSLTVEF